jgi:hypothetical protein
MALSNQMELFEGGDTSIDTSKLKSGVKEKKDARKIQFDNMTKMLTSGKVKDLSIEEKDKFVKLYKMLKQHHSFNDGGLLDEGGMIDEVSGNDVPSGSTREEVRDDIPAQLSEGEFVFPADVVRYIGLEKLMEIRQQAKQGLKQMEAMGQMGNSDEATMPDDLPFDETDLDTDDNTMPFDETDLDTEDDLEYNIGGVVPEQQGVYTAPTIPTLQNEGINTAPFPNMAAPKIPSTKKMYGPSTEPYVGANFEQLTGVGDIEVGKPTTELIRYVNPVTGQARMIPHLINADGTRGTTIYPIPEGFVQKAQTPEEKAQDATKIKVESTKVKPIEEGGDDGGKGPGTTAVDPNGDPFGYQSLFSRDALDKNMNKIGQMQLSLLGVSKMGMAAGILGKAAKGLMGKTDIDAISLGAITGYYSATKEALGYSGKNVATLGKTARAALSSSIDRAFTTVNNLTTDAKGAGLSQADTIGQVNSLAGLYGLSPVDTKGRNFNLNVQIGKKMSEIDRERDKVKLKIRQKGIPIGVQQGFTDAEALGLESLSQAQQKGFMDALGKGIGVNEYGGVSKDTLSDVQSIGKGITDNSFSNVTTDGVDTSDPNSESMGDMTNKGSLITKRKASGKLKPQYKKRGGLASR